MKVGEMVYTWDTLVILGVLIFNYLKPFFLTHPTHTDTHLPSSPNTLI